MSTRGKVISVLVMVALMMLPIFKFVQLRMEINHRTEVLANIFMDTQIMNLQAKPYLSGPTVIFFYVDFDYLESEVRLDFYDPEGLLVESTEQMFCGPGTYVFRFPYFGKQPSGIYFCRLTRNGQMIKMIKFIYLSGQVRNSARPTWAGFFFFNELRYNA